MSQFSFAIPIFCSISFMCSPPSCESVRDNFFPHLQNQTKIWHVILLIHAGSHKSDLQELHLVLKSWLWHQWRLQAIRFFRLNHFWQSAGAESEDRSSATHTFGNRVWQIIYWSWMKQKIGGMVGDTQSDVVRNESKVYNIRETKAVVCILTNEQELYILYLRGSENLLRIGPPFRSSDRLPAIQRIIVFSSLKPRALLQAVLSCRSKKEIRNWVVYRFHLPAFPHGRQGPFL